MEITVGIPFRETYELVAHSESEVQAIIDEFESKEGITIMKKHISRKEKKDAMHFLVLVQVKYGKDSWEVSE